MKKCISCKKEQPEDCFSKCKSNNSLTACICKTCSFQIKKERYMAKKGNFRRRGLSGKKSFYLARWYDNNKKQIQSSQIYAKRLLAQGTTLIAEEIPDILAELKIAQLQLARQIKEMQHEKR